MFNSEIQKGKHLQSRLTAADTTVSASSDIKTSRHILLQSKLRLWTIPDFKVSDKMACLFWFIFYLSRISVIEIGSD